jgi:hypothetical protein
MVWLTANGHGPQDRRIQQDRRVEDRRAEDQPVDTKKVAPYIVAEFGNHKFIQVWKLVDQGCEIYIVHTLASSNNSAIALGRGCGK